MSLDGRFVEQARRDLVALLALHPEIEEDEVLHVDMISAETSAMEMLDELIRVEREAKYLSMAVSDEIDRLAERMTRFENRRNAIRKYMMQLMDAAGLKKVERPAATVSIAAGRPKVLITNEQVIPDQFFRVKREINKEALREALLEDPVPGASFSNAEPVLRIS